ncbi:MAG: TVP38/TMEM64 family protein [Pseudomonadota bacterium]
MNKVLWKVILLLFVLAAGVYVFFHYNLHTYFANDEKAVEFINSFGSFSVAALIGLQILQVLVAPIPGEATGFVSGYLYGPVLGTLYSTIGLTLGSWIAFALSRKYGLPLVEKAISRELVEKYDCFMENRGIAVSFVLFLIPGFPKDALCYIIGLSHMRTGVFLSVSTVGRLLGTTMLSIAGSCARNRQGDALLIVLGVSGVLLLPLYFYREKILTFLKKKQ